MKLFIYSIRGTIFEGEVESVTLPGTDGELTILKNHASLSTSLKKGVLQYKNASGTQEQTLEEGFAYTDGHSTVVLVR